MYAIPIRVTDITKIESEGEDDVYGAEGPRLIAVVKIKTGKRLEYTCVSAIFDGRFVRHDRLLKVIAYAFEDFYYLQEFAHYSK